MDGLHRFLPGFSAERLFVRLFELATKASRSEALPLHIRSSCIR